MRCRALHPKLLGKAESWNQRTLANGSRLCKDLDGAFCFYVHPGMTRPDGAGRRYALAEGRICHYGRSCLLSMNSSPFDQAIMQIVHRDPRYAPEAYHFLREALDFTLERVIRAEGGLGRHVKGRELLEGIRDYALQEYGPMAYTVLEQWNIKAGIDIGRIVFNLIDAEIFSKEDSDSIDDFDGVMNLKNALEQPDRPTP